MKDMNNQVCERADDLIAFLYGELGDDDARKFQRHLHECARCETEFSAFGQIRQSIVSWRDEALGAAWSPEAVTDRSLSPIADRATTKPSALAAIREFFTLSPMWLKGAAAFASVLFCVCAVLAITYLRSGPSPLMQAQSGKIYTKQDLEARVAQEREKMIASQQQPQKQTVKETVSLGPAPPIKIDNRITVAKANNVVNSRSSRKPLTRQERQELAADLGLVTSLDEGLDLSNDTINQTPQ